MKDDARAFGTAADINRGSLELTRDDCCTFRKIGEPFGPLSNMHHGYGVEINGLRAAASEQLYQALKHPTDGALQRAIMAIEMAIPAKRFARQHQSRMRGDWTQVSGDVMLFCLRLKLAQNLERLGPVLERTEVNGRWLPIVEISYRDRFWGMTPDRATGTLRGQNVLGKLWTLLRDEYREHGADAMRVVPAPTFANATLAGEPLRGWPESQGGATEAIEGGSAEEAKPVPSGGEAAEPAARGSEAAATEPETTSIATGAANRADPREPPTPRPRTTRTPGKPTPNHVARGDKRGFTEEEIKRWRTAGWRPIRATDPDYPPMLRRLGPAAPATIWVTISDDESSARTTMQAGGGSYGGVGSLAENMPGGERERIIAWAQAKGAAAAKRGEVTVSGDATGCDQAFQTGALTAGGRVLAWLYSAKRNNPTGRYRNEIANGRVVLAMAWDPLQWGPKGGPMLRNKYIYCADRTGVGFVTRWSYRGNWAGGTWRGACEAVGTHGLGPIEVREPGAATGSVSGSGRKQRTEAAHELVAELQRLGRSDSAAIVPAEIDGATVMQTREAPETERHG